METMGLTWSPFHPTRKRSVASHRRKALRDFLVGLDKVVREQEQEGGEKIFVFTNESYVHQQHSYGFSYLRGGKQVETNEKKGGGGKGRRLIILHAITAEGPLAKTDKEGNFVSDLKWKGDTPHPFNNDE